MVSGESREPLLMFDIFLTVNCGSVILCVVLVLALSTVDVILLSALFLTEFELPSDDDVVVFASGEVELVVDFVMTLVGMGTLNKSFGFANIGLRGIDNSLVSNGFRNALGPCCELEPLGKGPVALFELDDCPMFGMC